MKFNNLEDLQKVQEIFFKEGNINELATVELEKVKEDEEIFYIKPYLFGIVVSDKARTLKITQMYNVYIDYDGTEVLEDIPTQQQENILVSIINSYKQVNDVVFPKWTKDIDTTKYNENVETKELNTEKMEVK
ncbi:hypothetical protein G8T75_12805 [Clostridium botulinum D/C]|uniref:hypothetical protein n=1 Tax=Clostridium botulinum TaxID=1491 RepID=UPI001E631129|nr:hypothetical protein [Clostridium botulinum]MCD3240837.1 hypothetical protein [Clostridium botulinum D/C]